MEACGRHVLSTIAAPWKVQLMVGCLSCDCAASLQYVEAGRHGPKTTGAQVHRIGHSSGMTRGGRDCMQQRGCSAPALGSGSGQAALAVDESTMTHACSSS